jgi:hypothetical protein
MHQDKLNSAHRSFTCFKKGRTIRFVKCDCVTIKTIKGPTPGGAAARVTIQDASYYALYPESPQFPHEKYVSDGSAGDTESKTYPLWDVEIAKHNERVWEGLLSEMRRLVEAGGGQFLKSR